MKLFKPSKKVAIITGVIVISVIGVVGVEAASNNTPKTATMPETTSQPESTTPTQENTSSATDSVDTAPVSVQPKAAPVNSTPASTPQPVTVTSYREIVIDENTSDCEYTYSDGTTYSWHWKTPQAVVITNSKGQTSGTAIHTVGVCDDTALGMPKN